MKISAEKLEEIIDYLNGNINQDRAKTLEREISESAELNGFVAEMKLYWYNSDNNSNHIYNTELAKANVNRRINSRNRLRARRIYISLSGIAAILIIALFIGNSLFNNNTINSDSGIYVAENNSNTPKEVILPDNSVVWLKQGARLEYYNNYKTDRQVNFSGMAFFNVQKNSNNAFVINTGKSSVKVLGTSFNLISNNKHIKLNLKTGKVLLTDSISNNKKIITKGYNITLNRDNHTLITQKNRSINYNSWLTSKLVFNNSSLGMICRDVSNHFNTRVTLKNPQDSVIRFTATYNNPDLDEIISSIEFATDTELIREK
ncbi:MAG: FecR family protein [Bacteroidales bacterium]|jgi:ferric-dicitrate binding protein FerR (iron transport regulator)|nr:FecR family protein [Bacteroidales bacterium]